MEHSEHLHEVGGHTGQREADLAALDELGRGVPMRLVELLASLAYLTPEGQQLALAAMGPGSRLVLEALLLVERGRPTKLTNLGRQLSERLADTHGLEASSALEIGQLGPRFRRIARVVPVSDRMLAAASTATENDQQGRVHRAVYELLPEPAASLPTGEGATVMVARSGSKVMLWQYGGRGTAIVIDTMEALPRGGQPVVLPNPDDEPPSRLLRHRLALSHESDD